jgi:hypothetical protein
MPVIGGGPQLPAPPQAPDGGFATWDAASSAVLYVPGTTVMRTGLGGSGVEATVESPSASLNSLVDAGSYYFPDGISPTDAPPGIDASLPYVLAVTSSPSTAAMSDQRPPHPAQLPVEPAPTVQGGIQILTLRSNPAVVYRRGFTDADPTAFTDWVSPGVPFTVAATPPASPAVGDVWIDTT